MSGMSKPSDGLDATTLVGQRGDGDLEEVDLNQSVMPTAVEQEGPSVESLRARIKAIKLSTFKLNMTGITRLFPKVRFPKFDFSAMLKSIKSVPGRVVNTLRNLASFLRRNPEAVAEAVVQGNGEPEVLYVAADGSEFRAPLSFISTVSYKELSNYVESVETGKETTLTSYNKAKATQLMLDYYSSPEMETRVNSLWNKFVKTSDGKFYESNATFLGTGTLRGKIRILLRERLLSRTIMPFNKPGSDVLEPMDVDTINEYARTGEYGKAAKPKEKQQSWFETEEGRRMLPGKQLLVEPSREVTVDSRGISPYGEERPDATDNTVYESVA